MSEAALNRIMQPTTDRKIRCEITNALKEPGTCDQTAYLPTLLKYEQEAAPTKKPRFIHRICETPEPVYHPFTREIDLSKLLYCIQGHALLIASDGTTNFLSGGSGTYIPAGIEYDLLLGRGTQNWITTHWEADSPMMVSPEADTAQTLTLTDTSEIFKKLTEKIISELGSSSISQNLILSWLHMFIYESNVGGRSFSLVPNLEDESESIVELISSIKSNPASDWNLNAAAEVAGYSPFHLSRLFRSTVNIGLPKFVEACRTEKAIEDLLSGSTPMTALFDTCGFGSPQAMRMAVREYTGFLPSELRARPSE